MAAPDLQITTDQFLQFGGQIFAKNVLAWDLRKYGIQVRTNVNTPQALTKLSAVGNPRPYSAADSTTNGVQFTDRVLTAYQSKWDNDFDPEQFRNTYLFKEGNAPFYEEALNQIAKEYLAAIYSGTLYSGVRNAAGTTAAGIADGWGTILAAEITATTITPVVTGAITDDNAVAKFELVADAAPHWMRERSAKILCSYAKFDNYVKNYRSTYGYNFDKSSEGSYKMDNKNFQIVPTAIMGTSSRLILTVDDNLVFGTNVEQIQVAASMRRNIIEVRNMMPAGCQIQDLEALVVNDQA